MISNKKYMNRIRLTESQLHRVIKESIRKVLKEVSAPYLQNNDGYGSFYNDVMFDAYKEDPANSIDHIIEDIDRGLQTRDENAVNTVIQKINDFMNSLERSGSYYKSKYEENGRNKEIYRGASALSIVIERLNLAQERLKQEGFEGMTYAKNCVQQVKDYNHTQND